MNDRLSEYEQLESDTNNDIEYVIKLNQSLTSMMVRLGITLQEAIGYARTHTDTLTK